MPLLALAMVWGTLGEPETLVGTVRVVGPALNRTVMLRLDKKDIPLAGEWVEELGHLTSAKVELLGKRDANGRFHPEAYRILAVSGNDQPPLVGKVVGLDNETLGLQDGEGTPIPLSVGPAARTRLAAQVGAKIWVYGKKLLSGELKVELFGILRPADNAGKVKANQ